MQTDSVDLTRRQWIKLYIKECLLGTIREELNPAQRGVWYDFLILAGNSRVPGIICANEETGLSVKRIAQILNTPEELINECIGLFCKSSRISVDGSGKIVIVNWQKYQHTDYDRQKHFRMLQQQKHREEVKGEKENIKKEKPLKKVYGEFHNILLTDEEYDKLKIKFGDVTKTKIEALSLGIESKGYKYKSHYATLLHWDLKDAKAKDKKPPLSRVPDKYKTPEELLNNEP